MCGRFYIAPEAGLEKTFAHIQLKLFPDLPVKYSGEIFPTDIVPVFIMENGRRMAKPMIWGFPRWGGKGVVFNARQETALTKPMFSKSLKERRVAILITGFFEWTPVPDQKKKDRYIFTLQGQKFLFLAGMWNSFHDPLSGQIPEHFTILTTNANDSMARFHDRMPIILTDDEVDDWLTADDFTKYLNREQPEVKSERSESSEKAVKPSS